VNKQNKVVSTEDTMKTLEIIKESNCKTLIADSTDIVKVRED
jgi:hypothetical protein